MWRANVKHSAEAAKLLVTIYKAAGVRVDKELETRLTNVADEMKTGKPINFMWRKLQESTRITAYCDDQMAMRTVPEARSSLTEIRHTSELSSTCFNLINTTLELVDSADFIIKVLPDNSGLTIVRGSNEAYHR